MRVVVFGKGLKRPLLLSHIVWDNDEIQSAYVLNGHWEFSRINGTLCVEGDIDSPMEEFETIIVIPTGLAGDHNDLIVWAENEVSK